MIRYRQRGQQRQLKMQRVTRMYQVIRTTVAIWDAAGYQNNSGYQDVSGYQNNGGYQDAAGYQNNSGYQNVTGYQNNGQKPKLIMYHIWYFHYFHSMLLSSVRYRRYCIFSEDQQCNECRYYEEAAQNAKMAKIWTIVSFCSRTGCRNFILYVWNNSRN